MSSKVRAIRQTVAVEAASTVDGPAVPSLAAVAVVACDESSRRATLLLGEREVEATLDAAVDAVVVIGAIARRERVVAQHEAGGWVVLGGLRTSATPGVDAGDEYVIEARRVELRGAHGVRLESGTSRVLLHPSGHIETLAETITTHARGVQRIIGRLLRLN